MRDLFNDNKTGKDCYPEEFKANKIIEDAANEITKIEQKIASLPDYNKPSFNFNPPGTNNSPSNNTKEKQTKVFLADIVEIKANTHKAVTQIFEKSTPEIRKKGFENLDKILNPEMNDTRSLQEKAMDKKGISKSQDVANSFIVLKQQENREKQQIKQPEKKEKYNENKEKSMLSMSAKFTASLGYTKMKAELKDMPDRSNREIEPEREKE